jgi:hypothetical protein
MLRTTRLLAAAILTSVFGSQASAQHHHNHPAPAGGYHPVQHPVQHPVPVVHPSLPVPAPAYTPAPVHPTTVHPALVHPATVHPALVHPATVHPTINPGTVHAQPYTVQPVVNAHKPQIVAPGNTTKPVVTVGNTQKPATITPPGWHPHQPVATGNGQTTNNNGKNHPGKPQTPNNSNGQNGIAKPVAGNSTPNQPKPVVNGGPPVWSPGKTTVVIAPTIIGGGLGGGSLGGGGGLGGGSSGGDVVPAGGGAIPTDPQTLPPDVPVTPDNTDPQNPDPTPAPGNTDPQNPDPTPAPGGDMPPTTPTPVPDPSMTDPQQPDMPMNGDQPVAVDPNVVLGVALTSDPFADSPASAAGMKANDVIMSLGGLRTEKREDMVAAARKFAGQEVSAIILDGATGDKKAVIITPTAEGKLGVIVQQVRVK